MSNALSRWIRRARGLPAVTVSGDIVAPENMLRVNTVAELTSFADLMMTDDIDIPAVGKLDSYVMLGMGYEALGHLDDYLEAVHLGVADRTDDDTLRQLRNLVAFGGAYVGEVLIQEVPGATWLTPDDMERDHSPMVLSLGGIDGQLTGAVYVAESDHFAFPHAKIFKFLMNGREDSTRFFVQVMADEMTRGAA